MRYVLLFLFCFFASRSNAQYTVLYENSFRNWAPGQGWVMINNDTIPKSAGAITHGFFGGVPVPFYLEIYENMLGVDQTLSATDKVMMTPPFVVGSNTFVRYYSNYTAGTELSLWVVPNHNDTTLSGLTDSIANCSQKGFNVFNISSYVGDTVRVAFRLRGVIKNSYIDNLLILDKYAHAWVPDSCFRSYLKNTIPSAFNGDSLNFIDTAVVLKTTISNPNSCMNSLEGLQYFVSLKYLNVQNNHIAFIPPNKINYLDSANVTNNYLPLFPDAPYCVTLRANNNLIKNIPNLRNDMLGVLHMKNNLLYDCLTCSNRFLDGDLTNNISTTNECFHYSLLQSAPIGSLPAPNCSQNLGSIKGRAYYDINQNGVFDFSDIKLANQKINYSQGTDITTFFDGTYSIVVDSGLVNMSLTALPNGFVCNTPLSDTIDVQEVITHDFIVTSTSNFNDLSVSLGSTGTTRLKEQLTLSLNVKNKGTQVTSGQVKMYLPPYYTLLNVQQGIVLNDTLTWNLTLNPFASNSNLITFIVDSLPVNLETIYTAQLAVSNDADTSNNHSSVAVMIRDSLVIINPPTGFPYDPNNKLVDKPIVSPGFNDYLTYNINFENIGSANASRVMVRDFLTGKLDVNSFELLATSHPCIVSFGADSLIQFLFDPIALTPTSIDSINSKGHIWFKIKPKNPINLGDTIYNSAGIYFDTQPAVITNQSMVWAEDSSGIVDFTSDKTNVCGISTHNVQFRNQSGNSPISLEWQFPGGNPSTSVLPNPIINYPTVGNYDVTLVVKYIGHNDTIVKPNYIHVFATNAATVSVTGNDSICAGDSVLLTTNAVGVSYLWSTGSTTASTYVFNTNYYYVTVTDSLGCRYSNNGLPLIRVLPNPVPLLTGTDSVCEGSSSYISVQPFSSYLWSTGEVSSSITPSIQGLYTVTVTSNFGCHGQSSFFLNVIDNPQPSITGPLSLCNGSLAMLDAGQGFTDYLWSTGVLTQTISEQQGGIYTVTVTNQLGCSGTDSFELSVIPTVPLNLNNDSICPGELVQIDAGSGYVDYLWSTSDTTQQIVVSLPGYYVVSVQDSNGCILSDSLLLSNYNSPLPSISSNDSICSGEQIICLGNYNSYSWSDGSTTQSITPNISGGYIVTVTDANGCIGRDSLDITVMNSPIPEITGIDTVCQGDFGSLYVGSYLSYLWSTGSTNPSIDPNTQGYYSVTVVDSNGCAGTDSIYFTILNTPNVLIAGADTICAGTETMLDAGSGFMSYLWSTQDTTEQILVNNAGQYIVTVVDSNGCSATIDHNLTVLTVDTAVIVNSISLVSQANSASWQWIYCDSSSIPNAQSNSYTATANGSYAVIVNEGGCVDTSSCYTIIVTGLNSNTENKLFLFPNPVNDVLNISGLKDAEIQTMKILSATGQLVKIINVDIGIDNLMLDVSQFAEGVYFVVMNSNSSFSRYRFIINHTD